MLDFVRKNAKSWVIKVALLIIVFVFVLWGGYSYQSIQASRLARVGDHYITYGEYGKMYDYLSDLYKRQLGDAFSEELLRRLNLKEQALNMLVDRYLIADSARALGLEATVSEIQQAIVKFPAFQKDGKFDSELYTMALRQARMDPQEFETEIAQNLTVQKVQEFVRRRAVITDDELKAYARFNNTLIQLAYVQFDANTYEDQVTVDDKAVEEYYESQKERYREPEKRQIALVTFPSEGYVADASVSEEEITRYYEDHEEEFHQEAQVRASHILFRVAEDAPEDEVEKVKAEALKVLEEARAPGADFEALAKKYSQDPSAAQNSGDLGYFERERMVPAFSDAAFAMKPGEISDLVRSPFGFHIIKAVDARPEKTTPIEEARSQIVDSIKREKARDVAYNKARDFADLAYAERDIRKAAEEQKLQVVAPGTWLAPTDPLPNVGPSPKVMQELFNLREKGVSTALETTQGFLVAQVEAIQEPQIPPLDQVKDRVLKDVRAEQARNLAKTKAAEFLEKARSSKDLQQAAAENGLTAKTTDWFSRKQPDKELRLLGEGQQKVFQLGEAKPFPDEPIDSGRNFLVVQLLGEKAPDAETLEKEMTTLRTQLHQQKQAQIWEAWLSEQRSKANIELLQKL